MELNELKILLQRYFDGETSPDDEKVLSEYFSSGKVETELQEYAGFFAGLGELSQAAVAPGFDEQVMDYILEHENAEKNRYRSMWKAVTGIAAVLIFVLGGLLVYEQYRNPFKDTFSNPEDALAYTQKTFQYMSGKYNTGVEKLSKTKKFNEALAQLQKVEVVSKAGNPLAKGLNAVNKGFDELENIEKKIK